MRKCQRRIAENALDLQALKVENEFRRKHFPFIRTIEDLLLIREIGLHQAAGNPLVLKTLYTLGIASVATVQRRLARLKRMGVVTQSRTEHDKRLVRLTLSKHVFEKYGEMGRVLRKFWRARGGVDRAR